MTREADVLIWFAKKAIEMLKDDAATLAAALEPLIDPDPCWYDHHGDCQAHDGGQPCLNANAIAALAAHRAITEKS